jgi:hypothetical protein
MMRVARPTESGSAGVPHAVEAEPSAGGSPDVDQVLAQGVGRDTIDGLVDECINSLSHTVSRIRDRERFHCDIVPTSVR